MLNKTDLHFLQMAALQSEKDPKNLLSHHADGGPVKKSRGAILVLNNKIVGEGISQHLGGNLYKPDTEERYVATVNAELVAVGEAINKGVAPLTNLTMYISDSPNWYTFKMLVTLGLKRIVHYGPANNDRITHYAQELGVELISVG